MVKKILERLTVHRKFRFQILNGSIGVFLYLKEQNLIKLFFVELVMLNTLMEFCLKKNVRKKILAKNVVFFFLTLASCYSQLRSPDKTSFVINEFHN